MRINTSSALLAFRRRHLLTQEQAAAAVGVSLSTWRQIERGFRGREPPRALLAHLAALDLLAERNLAWPEPKRSDHA